jgi:hypothetical protein
MKEGGDGAKENRDRGPFEGVGGQKKKIQGGNCVGELKGGK